MSALWLRLWGYPHYMCSYGWPYPCRFHQLKAWFTGDDVRWKRQEFALWEWYEQRVRDAAQEAK